MPKSFPAGLANPSRRRKCVRMHRQGYKLWRIAKETGEDKRDVAALLVAAGCTVPGFHTRFGAK